jgi:hypothetical protein
VVQIYLSLTRAPIQAGRILVTCRTQTATDHMQNVFVKTCYTTLTPVLLVYKRDKNAFSRVFVTPRPEMPSPLRPLLVEALDAGMNCGSFGMCSEYVDNIQAVYKDLVSIASKGQCAGFLPWTEAGKGLNLDRVRTIMLGMLCLCSGWYLANVAVTGASNVGKVGVHRYDCCLK